MSAPPYLPSYLSLSVPRSPSSVSSPPCCYLQPRASTPPLPPSPNEHKHARLALAICYEYS
ncbi:hypothetical protein E2C01_067660 [Portunus trituberculatus]|uniref:Uncharacterized protein n=1 Tax=Portunus trituberculatus TaxID=210409 RepID=A0A5B7HUD2_PORTR|nr:hypothetical protein [Portunus trituberculatus]